MVIQSIEVDPIASVPSNDQSSGFNLKLGGTGSRIFFQWIFVMRRFPAIFSSRFSADHASTSLAIPVLYADTYQVVGNLRCSSRTEQK